MQGGFAAMDSALASVDRKDVQGIGISGQQHGFVPLDGDGQVWHLCSPLPRHSMYPCQHCIMRTFTLPMISASLSRGAGWTC